MDIAENAFAADFAAKELAHFVSKQAPFAALAGAGWNISVDDCRDFLKEP